MRRALGLEGGASKGRQQDRPDAAQRQAERFTVGHKRRFVQDGEVPVTVVSSRRDSAGEATPHRGAPGTAAPSRLEAAENALAHEITSRQQAERALAEAHATIHDLQTKLGHAELARAEAADGLHREQETIVVLRSELRACEERLHAAESVRTAAERSAHTGRGPVGRPRRRVPDFSDAAESENAVFAVARPEPAFAAARPEPGARRAKAAERKPALRSKLVRWWIKEDAKPE